MTEPSGTFEALRKDGAAAVHRALGLELSAAGWSEVDALVKELAVAFDARDVHVMAEAILDLDGLRGPSQQEGGATSTPPPDTRTESMKLVHRLVPPDKANRASKAGKADEPRAGSGT
ncbi:hypothetical protein ND748_05000 [Frankia sp. AiPs1]|uniref:CATRA system-associated protein n=1 Tax=Frankia sp. AiPs1 TaxID=573493 RepID=UPI002043DEA8|nr:CATRA system-associated protein [Frankia sp. AiPs1]MCM3921035.1 hypothetical protein [Frankia sp. AiPs1]